jgi:hypothetical protein
MSAMENGYEELDEQLKAKSAVKIKDEPSVEVLSVDDAEATPNASANTVIKVTKQGSSVSEIENFNVKMCSYSLSHLQMEAAVAKSARNVVENKPKPAFQPMRFKNAAPEGFVARRQKERQLAMENYLQVAIRSYIHGLKAAE